MVVAAAVVCVCRKKYKGVSFEVTAATGKPASPPSPTHSLGYHAIAQSLFEVRLVGRRHQAIFLTAGRGRRCTRHME